MKESVVKLLQQCNAKGIALTVDNGQLRYKAPTGVIDDDFKAQLKAHKPQLMELLSARSVNDPFDNQVQEAIGKLNYRGVSVMDVPEAIRHQAYELELEFTEAANHGDRNRFFALLRRWRECFH